MDKVIQETQSGRSDPGLSVFKADFFIRDAGAIISTPPARGLWGESASVQHLDEPTPCPGSGGDWARGKVYALDADDASQHPSFDSLFGSPSDRDSLCCSSLGVKYEDFLPHAAHLP